MLIGPRVLKSPNGLEKIQPRMMVATFNGNPSATIISCCNLPVLMKKLISLPSIMSYLPLFVASRNTTSSLLVEWIMNAQIGKNHKFSIHNLSNRSGEYLTDFTLENRLLCLNTKFQKREGKPWTKTFANNTKAQIDYAFINEKWNNSPLNCEAYSSFEGVFSDHRIVTAKIRLSLRRNAARTTTTVHYDWSLLYNRDISDKYTLALRNKFDALQEKSETHTPNDKYENFVKFHLEAAAECIPTKQRAKSRVPWETLAVRTSRKMLKLLPNAIGGTQPISMPRNLKKH